MSSEACPTCGQPDVAPWRVAHAVLEGQRTSEGWMLQRCQGCGTASFAHPDRAPAPRELYETGVYERGAGRWDRWLERIGGLLDRERLRLVGPLPAEARVIEVGAGRGRLVAVLRANGHDAVGIEPSRASASIARAEHLPVERLALEEASFPPASADLIVLWHVLEHFDRPTDVIARVRPWLKSQGRMVIAVPNLGSLQARLGGDRWFHQDVPRHRTHFTAAGLTALLRRSGFTPARARHLMIDQNWLGMWLTLLNRLTAGRDVPYRYVKRDLRYPSKVAAVRDAAICAALGVPAMLAAPLLELGAGLARHGGTIVVHASPRAR